MHLKLFLTAILSTYGYLQPVIPVDLLLTDFNNLSVANSAIDAKKINKNISTTALFRQKAQEQIKALYNQSQSKSGLLLMMALPDQYARNQIDFNKLKLSRDKVLDEKMKDANAMFFYYLDNALRAVNNIVDSIYKTQNPSAGADAVLAEYNRQTLMLKKQTLTVFQDPIKYCQQKKYNEVLANRNADNPYYIQLLEIQATIIDRMLLVNTQVEAGNDFVAAITQ